MIIYYRPKVGKQRRSEICFLLNSLHTTVPKELSPTKSEAKKLSAPIGICICYRGAARLV